MAFQSNNNNEKKSIIRLHFRLNKVQFNWLMMENQYDLLQVISVKGNQGF